MLKYKESQNARRKDNSLNEKYQKFTSGNQSFIITISMIYDHPLFF